MNNPHHIFYITTTVDDNENQQRTMTPNTSNISDRPSDSKIGVKTFCASFPFHVIFDQDMQILQLGSSLAKMVVPGIPEKGRDLWKYFDIVKPKVRLSFYSLLSRVNSSFVIRTKDTIATNQRLSEVGEF